MNLYYLIKESRSEGGKGSEVNQQLKNRYKPSQYRYEI